MAEATVDGQTEFHRPGDVFLVIRVGRYFHDNLCADTFQMFHQPQRERVGVVGRPDVDKFYFFAACIFDNGGVVDAFPHFRCGSCPEIGNDFVVYHQTAFAMRGDVIITQAGIHSTFFESFYLIMYFLTNSICFIEAMEDKEQGFHSFLKSLYIVYSVFLFPFSRHAAHFSDNVKFVRSLYISSKDNKTNNTFSYNCHKNIHSLHCVLHGNEGQHH